MAVKLLLTPNADHRKDSKRDDENSWKKNFR